MAEARALYQVVQPIIATLSTMPTSSELLSACEDADNVCNFFAGTSVDFYVVIVGSPPGIHRSCQVKLPTAAH